MDDKWKRIFENLSCDLSTGEDWHFVRMCREVCVEFRECVGMVDVTKLRNHFFLGKLVGCPDKLNGWVALWWLYVALKGKVESLTVVLNLETVAYPHEAEESTIAVIKSLQSDANNNTPIKLSRLQIVVEEDPEAVKCLDYLDGLRNFLAAATQSRNLQCIGLYLPPNTLDETFWEKSLQLPQSPQSPQSPLPGRIGMASIHTPHIRSICLDLLACTPKSLQAMASSQWPNLKSISFCMIQDFDETSVHDNLSRILEDMVQARAPVLEEFTLFVCVHPSTVVNLVSVETTSLQLPASLKQLTIHALGCQQVLHKLTVASPSKLERLVLSSANFETADGRKFIACSFPNANIRLEHETCDDNAGIANAIVITKNKRLRTS